MKKKQEQMGGRGKGKEGEQGERRDREGQRKQREGELLRVKN